MSLSLPINNKLREMFQVSDLVEYKNLPDFRQALSIGQKAASSPIASSANCLAVRADGQIWLIQVGPKGGWERLWNFGKP